MAGEKTEQNSNDDPHGQNANQLPHTTIELGLGNGSLGRRIKRFLDKIKVRTIPIIDGNTDLNLEIGDEYNQC